MTSASDIILQVMGGILLADLLSGIVHWFEDTYGDPKWPIIGKTIIEPNIVHHTDPLKFTRASFWKRNRGVIGVMLVFAGVFTLAGWINVLTVTALLVGTLANEAHRWAHLRRDELPKLIRALQHVGILQSQQHHWAHHRQGFNTHYCTITNMLNPTIDGLKLFRIVEGIIEGLFQIRPRIDRAAHHHPFLGRRWIDKARRIACISARTVRRRLAIDRGTIVA